MTGKKKKRRTEGKALSKEKERIQGTFQLDFSESEPSIAYISLFIILEQ